MNQQPVPQPPVVSGFEAPGFEKKKKPFLSVKRVFAMTIGTLIGIPLMLVGFIHFQSAVFTRASNITPRDLIITQTTADSATVRWSTGEETQGTILYGTDPGAMRLLAPELERVTEHEVTIELLAPSSTYYFMIRIGDELFDNGGEPWTFTTKSLDPEEVVPTVVRPTSATCPQTDDCNVVREQVGSGCTVTDYVQCVQRQQ